MSIALHSAKRLGFNSPALWLVQGVSSEKNMWKESQSIV